MKQDTISIFRALLLASTALAAIAVAPLARAQQTDEVAPTVRFDIPKQNLNTALSAFARQSGIRFSYPASLTTGKVSPALHGNFPPAAALSQLLGGSGLGWNFTDSKTVVITGPGSAEQPDYSSGDDAVMLGTIVLGGGSGAYWDGDPLAVYDTTANVAAITGQTIETYQIATPSDVLKGTTGVMSGDSRNSGSLNVNIHGLQGQGRVPVTVDGAENNTTVYRGYQGVGDRSFIDPDFISSAAIEKGASTARAGIGGAVAITTLTADDVAKAGRKSGFRLKFSASGNTSDPVRGTLPGQGAGRSSLLSPTGGSASIAYGYKGDLVELVAGISTRDTGNYHAGSKGDTEGWVYTQFGTRTWGTLSPIGYDDEVLNTSNSTNSGLIKLTFNFSDDLKWQLGYSKYNTQFGEIMPSRYTTIGSASQWRLSETELDSLTSRLRWNPNGSQFVDLRWNIWRTALDTQSAPITDDSTLMPESSDVTLGTDLSNKARFETGWGRIDWTLGASFKHEEARATAIATGSDAIREGKRNEAALFTTGEWAVTDWLSFNGGLRYNHAKTTPEGVFSAPPVSDTSFDKSIGLSVRPINSLTLYANYRHASRLPSLYETLMQAQVDGAPEIAPERVRNLDVGLNILRDDLFGDDSLRVKLAYFDSDVGDYIARDFARVGPNNISAMYFVNIDKARFTGFDFSTEYARHGFAAKFGATYYTDVEFCYSGVCGENSIGTDYAKNHVPPKFQLSLDLSQKLFDERLTLGGRLSRYGSRATDATTTLTTSSLVAPVDWKPVTLVDLYAHYQINTDTRISFDVQNVTDEYYVEPMSLAPTPGPGRSARVMLDYRF